METTIVSAQSKREYVQAIYQRYRRAGRPEKQRILDEFCEVTGHHRKHAIRLLNGPGARGAAPRAAPRLTYGAAAIAALRTIWGAAGYPWSRPPEGAAAAVAALGSPPAAPAPSGRAAVAAHQPAPDGPTARALPPPAHEAAVRAHQARARCSSTTFPSRRIAGTWQSRLHRDRSGRPLRQLGRRRVRALAQPHGHPHHVGGDGRRARQEPAAVQGARGTAPGAALPATRHRLGQRLGVHQPASVGLLPGPGVQFTRGRPYKKDDNAHIEQKNWTHVRKLLGYVRYDSPAAQAAIHALYRDELRLFRTCSCRPSSCSARSASGAVRRRYDAPRTPLERVLACSGDSPGGGRAAAAAARRASTPSPSPRPSSSSSSASTHWPTRAFPTAPSRPLRPCPSSPRPQTAQHQAEPTPDSTPFALGNIRDGAMIPSFGNIYEWLDRRPTGVDRPCARYARSAGDP